jgi:predicted RNase H-like HicB family nuclease
MKKVNLTAVIWEEEGKYVSKCPELGVASCGDSPEEARENLREAVELYLANAKELNMIDELLPVLSATAKFTSSLSVSL